MHLSINGKKTSKFIWQCTKPKINYKNLQFAKEGKELQLPDFKMYFAACCLVWMTRVYFAEKKKVRIRSTLPEVWLA